MATQRHSGWVEFAFFSIVSSVSLLNSTKYAGTLGWNAEEGQSDGHNVASTPDLELGMAC